jgi:hypothetical protein
MSFRSLSLTTPSSNLADAAPATPPDYVFPCNVKYDFGGGGGGTIIDPVSPPAPTGATWTVGTLGGENFPDLVTALASASVVNGARLLLSAQTFTVAAAITVSKQVTIQGASRASTILQTAAAAGDPVTMITVTTSNVVFRDMTIKHRKTSNTSIETAVSINAGAGSSGHFLENVAVECVEFGVVIRSDGWQINNCHLAYVGPNNSTRRLIGVYRSAGQGLFTNSTYNSGQNGVITGNCRVFCVLSTTGLPSEVLSGYLRLGYITSSNNYPMQQFFNCEWFQNGGTPLTFCVDNCNTKANGSSGETSAFIVWTQTAPTLSQCAQVNLTNNTLSNVHGKGAFALNGASGLGTPGSTAFYASGNTITSTPFIAPFATGITGSADPTVLAQIGYDTTRWTNPSQAVTVPAGLSGLFVVDGVTLLDGYRVFVVDSGNAVTSGIYSANAGAWYRSQDMIVGDDAAGDRFTVTQGTVYNNTNWLCTNSIGNGIVGTDPLVFASV